ncbi:hypothetical protein EMCG_05110 [[Emmonsia] crescens]|uniref:Aminoglycoside phosphotransferase domain-containing protein n=1 Tax=[Emmonsia] crescens TaxID=73230 RepID=A0A0G2HQB0_9EURO|nr:hypothetical protein EMCG_05110 [Emmonsia crescens UAMH 3008]
MSNLMLGGRPNVLRLDEHRVLKTNYPDRGEADILRFVAAHTTIPVPRVYDTKLESSRREATTSYMVIEYMPGLRLDKAWVKLTESQRVATCHQLVEYLAQLQPLTSNRIEGLNGAPVHVGCFQSRWGGPFSTETEFNNFMAKGDNVTPRPTANHVIHFAHADLSPRNILVDENTGEITAIVDWERAGWYPEYWDVVRMITDCPGRGELPGYAIHLRAALRDLHKKYELELAAMIHILRLDTPGPG